MEPSRNENGSPKSSGRRGQSRCGSNDLMLRKNVYLWLLMAVILHVIAVVLWNHPNDKLSQTEKAQEQLLALPPFKQPTHVVSKRRKSTSQNSQVKVPMPTTRAENLESDGLDPSKTSEKNSSRKHPRDASSTSVANGKGEGKLRELISESTQGQQRGNTGSDNAIVNQRPVASDEPHKATMAISSRVSESKILSSSVAFNRTDEPTIRNFTTVSTQRRRQQPKNNNNTAVVSTTPLSTTTTTPSCQSCTDYSNIIVANNYCCAGLFDRIHILTRLSELASYFCARVFVAPPYQVLWAFHNKGPVPKDLTWTDVSNLTFSVPDNNNSTSIMVFEQYNEELLHPNTTLADMFQDEVHKNWKRLVSRPGLEYGKPEQTLEARKNLETMEALVETQLLGRQGNLKSSPTTTTSEGFVWEVHSEIWGWDSVVTDFWATRQEAPDKNCRIGNVQKNPALNDVLANQVFDLLFQTYPHDTQQLGLLHVRRQDAKKGCNNGVKKMAMYLRCGTKGIEEYSNTTTILFASDDENPCYRNTIMDLVREHGITVVDLDSFILDYLQEYVASISTATTTTQTSSNTTTGQHRLLSNMFRFGVVAAMYHDPRIQFHLIQRWSNCDRCSKLTDRLVNATVHTIHGQEDTSSSNQSYTRKSTKPMRRMQGLNVRMGASAIERKYEECRQKLKAQGTK